MREDLITQYAQRIIDQWLDWEEEAGDRAQREQNDEMFDEVMRQRIGEVLYEFAEADQKPETITTLWGEVPIGGEG